jgi:hypothetical protein
MTQLGTNRNPYKDSLFYLSAKTPEDLERQIKEIRSPLEIKSIYSHNNRHIAWIVTGAKVKRTKKKTKQTSLIKDL